MTVNLNLDTDQLEAMAAIAQGTSAFALGGYAGSGKTEVAAQAALELGERAVLMAPTNKAAAVLTKRTGRPVSTIHKRTLQAVPRFDPDGNVVGVDFEPLDDLILPEDPVAIVDEASMVSHELWGLMQSSLGDRVPIALVGDPFQLPPVNAESVFDTALEQWPSKVLTNVYRQAKGSAVLDYATELRTAWSEAPDLLERFELLSPIDQGFLGAAYSGAATVITWSNEIRMARIRQMRRAIWGHEFVLPQKGEPMIGYSSSPGDGIVNGFQYTVVGSRDVGDNWMVTVESEFGGQHVVAVDPGLAFDAYQKSSWFPKQRANPMDRTAPLTFAYAITGHASQGSQWPWVMIERQKIDTRDNARWVYTALTRAQDGVYVL